MNNRFLFALKTTLNAGLSNSLPFLKDQKRNKKVSRCRGFCNNADFPHLTQSKPFRLPVYLNLSMPRRAGTSGLLTMPTTHDASKCVVNKTIIGGGLLKGFLSMIEHFNIPVRCTSKIYYFLQSFTTTMRDYHYKCDSIYLRVGPKILRA